MSRPHGDRQFGVAGIGDADAVIDLFFITAHVDQRFVSGVAG
jgi:hypothetical protein